MVRDARGDFEDSGSLRGFRLSQPVRISLYADWMLKALLEAVLGRRRVRALRTLVTSLTAALMILVPGAAGAVFRTAIHEEQARVTPLVEQFVRHISQHFDYARPLHLPHIEQQRPSH